MPVQEAQEEDEEKGERWSDRGVSVCLLLQESEEVDEEAGFGKSTEGERESERAHRMQHVCNHAPGCEKVPLRQTVSQTLRLPRQTQTTQTQEEWASESLGVWIPRLGLIS